MKALVTVENADEVVEDFDLKRMYDKVTIQVSDNAVYQITVTHTGALRVYCSEGPGIMGPSLAVQPESSNVLLIKAGSTLS